MKKPEPAQGACSICGGRFPERELVPGDSLRRQITDQILKEKPEWTAAGLVCRQDLSRFRLAYVQSLMASEKGELSALEQEVLDSIQKHELITRDVDSEFEQDWSFGERLADKIADFGGSWAFLICFGVFLALWITVNSLVLFWRPADPYPFILLNLILSCLAAIQAPIIMMSQNRQAERDRLRAVQDYEVNLKAELEIMSLHEKLEALRDKDIAEIKGQIAALGRVG